MSAGSDVDDFDVVHRALEQDSPSKWQLFPFFGYGRAVYDAAADAPSYLDKDQPFSDVLKYTAWQATATMATAAASFIYLTNTG